MPADPPAGATVPDPGGSADPFFPPQDQEAADASGPPGNDAAGQGDDTADFGLPASAAGELRGSLAGSGVAEGAIGSAMSWLGTGYRQWVEDGDLEPGSVVPQHSYNVAVRFGAADQPYLDSFLNFAAERRLPQSEVDALLAWYKAHESDFARAGLASGNRHAAAAGRSGGGLTTGEARELAGIERMMRENRRQYFRDERAQGRYRALLAKRGH